MSLPIAPPADFNFLPGTGLASVSAESLDRVLEALDLTSLLHEQARLEAASQKLEESNAQILEFIQLEQQDTATTEPDPDFLVAIEENKVIIAKYEQTCVEIRKAILKKREQEGFLETTEAASSSSLTDPLASSSVSSTTIAATSDAGLHANTAPERPDSSEEGVFL